MQINSGNVCLEHLGVIFPGLQPIMMDAPCYLLEFSQILLQYLLQDQCNIEDGALLCQKLGNGLPIVTKSFILKVTGVQYLTLKLIDKFRVSSVWVSLVVFISAFTCSKSTIGTLEQPVKYVQK